MVHWNANPSPLLPFRAHILGVLAAQSKQSRFASWGNFTFLPESFQKCVLSLVRSRVTREEKSLNGPF